jgi:lysozyme
VTTADREALRAQLVRHEGLRLKPYRCSAGRLTIGVGRNLEDRGITAPEAMVLLSDDISEIELALRRALPWFGELDGVRQRALIDMAFMGVSKLLGFRRMLAALQHGDYVEAKREALDSKWARDVGPSRAMTIARMLHTGVAPEFR